MSHPGPKPVDIPLLKTHARHWYQLLLVIARGRAGMIVEDNDTVVLEPSDEIREKLPELEKMRGTPGVLWFRSPIFPQAEIWEELKRAGSAKEMQKALAGVEKYLRKGWRRPPVDRFLGLMPLSWAETVWGKLVRAAQDRADDLVQAMDLPHYPRTQRPSSDLKRIEFFAKVLAGLALGLSPLTTTKRLSRWRPSQPEPVRPPLRARGYSCPHCRIDEVKGFPPGTVVRCPGCGERYYIAKRRRVTKP